MLPYCSFVCHFLCVMHQSIPAVPMPPRANLRALAFFLNGQIPRGGDTLAL